MSLPRACVEQGPRERNKKGHTPGHFRDQVIRIGMAGAPFHLVIEVR